MPFPRKYDPSYGERSLEWFLLTVDGLLEYEKFYNNIIVESDTDHNNEDGLYTMYEIDDVEIVSDLIDGFNKEDLGDISLSIPLWILMYGDLNTLRPYLRSTTSKYEMCKNYTSLAILYLSLNYDSFSQEIIDGNNDITVIYNNKDLYEVSALRLFELKKKRDFVIEDLIFDPVVAKLIMYFLDKEDFWINMSSDIKHKFRNPDIFSFFKHKFVPLYFKALYTGLEQDYAKIGFVKEQVNSYSLNDILDTMFQYYERNIVNLDIPPAPLPDLDYFQIQREYTQTEIMYFFNTDLKPHKREYDCMTYVTEWVYPWCTLRKSCLNANTISVSSGTNLQEQTEDPDEVVLSKFVTIDLDEEDMTRPLITQYKCYLVSDLLASFRLEDGRMVYGIPDAKQSDTIKVFNREELIALRATISNIINIDEYIGDIFDFSEEQLAQLATLMDKIEYKPKLDWLGDIKDKYNQFGKEDQDSILLYFTWMFFLSQYNRDWHGPSDKAFPKESVKINKTDVCEIARHNAQSKTMYTVLLQHIIPTFSQSVVKFLKTIPIITIAGEIPQQGLASIYTSVLDGAYGSKCHGILGNDLVHTSYWVLKTLTDDTSGFDEYLKEHWPEIYDLEMSVINDPKNLYGTNDELGSSSDLTFLIGESKKETIAANTEIKNFAADTNNAILTYDFTYNARQQTGHIEAVK